jgi:hypothetical protein
MAYARRYDINWNYTNSVRERAGLVALEYDSKLLVDQILMTLKGTVNQNAKDHIANMLVATIHPYVPRNSGTLATEGLYVGINKGLTGHAEIDIRYRNTTNVKYVLYQYYGIVYGPNYATWEQRAFNPRDLRKSHSPATHSGWVSPRGKGTKHPTGGKLGKPRPPLRLPDGRIITYSGYTNPNSHAKWLEYVRDTSSIWSPLMKDIQKEIKAMFDDGWLRMRGKMPSINVVKYLKYTRLNSPYSRRYKTYYQRYIKKVGKRVNVS